MEEGYLGALEGYFFNSHEAIHVQGWFKAPRTGNYNFITSADDTIQFFINPNNGSSDRTQLESISYSCGLKPNRFYY
jgi:hypothetical protein